MSVIRSSVEPSEVFRGGRAVEQIMRGERELWTAESWPMSGTWSGNTDVGTTSIFSFTVTEDGAYDLGLSVTWSGTGVVAGSAQFTINGGEATTGNLVSSAPGTSTVTDTGVALRAGDVVEFSASVLTNGNAASAEWSINQTALTVTGDWSTDEPSTIARQVAEHTVTEDGLYTIAWTVTDSEMAVAYITTPSGNPGTVTGTDGEPAEVVAEQSLLAGDTITFHAVNRGAPASGHWAVLRVGDWITKIQQMRPDFLLPFQNALTEQSGTQSSTLVSTTGGEVKWNFASAEDPNNFYGTYGGKQEWSAGNWSKGSGFGSTIGAWIKCPASNAGGRDAIHWRSSNGRWEMYISCDTNLGQFYGGALINGQWRGLPVTGGNFRGQWAHVALTYLYGSLMLYVNGAYVSGVAIPDSTVAVPNSPVWVGAGMATQPWNVVLDDVFVFSRSLTVTEIAAIAAAPRTKPQS